MRRDEEVYLREMMAKLHDPSRPLFTAAEVALWASIVQGMEIEESNPYIRKHCLAQINVNRDHLCLYT